MTRFARAKGSKASNERAPEEATSWAVMKEQLERAKADAEHARLREQAEKQRMENYENFLKEQKSAKRKSTWCEFPGEPVTQIAGKRYKSQLHSQQPQHKGHNPDTMKNKKKKNNKEFIQTENNYQNGGGNSYGPETPALDKKEKKKIKRITENPQILETNSSVDDVTSYEKKKNKPKNNTEVIEEQIKEVSKSNNNENNLQERKKKKKQITENAQIVETHQVETNSSVDNVKSNKRKKNNHKPKNNTEIKEEQCQVVTKSNNPQNNSQEGKKKKKDKQKPAQQQDNKQDNETPPNKTNIEPTSRQKKKNKLQEGIVARRKPEGDRMFELVINGRPVELIRYDGFPVMKKDAERLEELKNSMMKKGIPKCEIQRTMKLERRRAEKALARLKRDVCYNCRKGGHNLSDCPELRGRLEAGPEAEAGIVGAADGLCFKCGSTEHRAYECRVQRSQQYSFANCFICKEQGHIARQCPDNPKGLYPNGGSCKLCGDVTHLRKDCPTTKSEKEETSVRLDTLAAPAGVEDVSAPPATATTDTTKQKKHKKITF